MIQKVKNYTNSKDSELRNRSNLKKFKETLTIFGNDHSSKDSKVFLLKYMKRD